MVLKCAVTCFQVFVKILRADVYAYIHSYTIKHVCMCFGL